jgi:hypothetical protein
MSTPLRETGSSYLLLIEAITSTALSHDEQCECRVCAAASGDERAMAEVTDAYARARVGA